MSVTEHFKLSAVDCGETGIITGIRSHGFASGKQTEALVADGQLDPTLIACLAQDPVIDFSTLDVAAALGAAGIGGLEISADPAAFYLAKIDDLGAPASGSVHRSFSMAKGRIAIERISARQGALVEVPLRAVAVSTDGVTAPITFAANVALPSLAVATAGWTVGPVSINGTALDGIQEIDINFGLQMQPIRGDGEPYPVRLNLTRAPEITLRALKSSMASTLGIAGAAQGATASEIYLRAVGSDGFPVANGTSGHIKLSIASGSIDLADGRANQGSDPATVGITIRPAWDGTNAIIAVTTATTIS